MTTSEVELILSTLAFESRTEEGLLAVSSVISCQLIIYTDERMIIDSSIFTTSFWWIITCNFRTFPSF